MSRLHCVEAPRLDTCFKYLSTVSILVQYLGQHVEGGVACDCGCMLIACGYGDKDSVPNPHPCSPCNPGDAWIMLTDDDIPNNKMP